MIEGVNRGDPVCRETVAQGQGRVVEVVAGFTHKGLRSYSWGGFGDVRFPDALTEPAECEASKRPQRRLRACF
jgi:hypothetical protein